ARRLRLRVQALRAWMPELGLPDVSDAQLLATLDDWLAPYLSGKRRLDALGAEELSQALSSLLDHAQRADAKTRICARHATGAGGEAAGIVRSRRYPARGWRPRAGDPAPAVARGPADSGDAGSEGLLGAHLSRSEEGNEGALPTPPMARRSVERRAHAPREAARHVMHLSRGASPADIPA